MLCPTSLSVTDNRHRDDSDAEALHPKVVNTLLVHRFSVLRRAQTQRDREDQPGLVPPVVERYGLLLDEVGRPRLSYAPGSCSWGKNTAGDAARHTSRVSLLHRRRCGGVWLLSPVAAGQPEHKRGAPTR